MCLPCRLATARSGQWLHSYGLNPGMHGALSFPPTVCVWKASTQLLSCTGRSFDTGLEPSHLLASDDSKLAGAGGPLPSRADQAHMHGPGLFFYRPLHFHSSWPFTELRLTAGPHTHTHTHSITVETNARTLTPCPDGNNRDLEDAAWIKAKHALACHRARYRLTMPAHNARPSPGRRGTDPPFQQEPRG